VRSSARAERARLDPHAAIGDGNDMPNRWRTLGRPTRKDEDHDSVVARLRAMGATTDDIFRPLDLLVGFRGVTMLVEVKAPLGPRGGGTAKDGQALSDRQQTFVDSWHGAAPLVVTLADCAEKVLAEAERVLCRKLDDVRIPAAVRIEPKPKRKRR
jgi:hypothetical protein